MSRLSLASRAFLFSFIPVCVALLSISLALNSAVHQRVRQDLREALQNSDELLNRASAEYTRQNAALLAKLTDSAGLKASVGLVAEGARDSSAVSEVRRTIEMQLSELQSASPYDLLVVSDISGRTLAAVPPLGPWPAASGAPAASGLTEIGRQLFQLQTVPIEIGGDTVATLTLGRRFDLEHLLTAGKAALLKDGIVVRSTFPAAIAQQLVSQLRLHCPNIEAACEVSLGGESYLVSILQRAQLGAGYRLLGFRSLDVPLRSFNRAFLPILIEVSAGGTFLALACTLLTSQSVSRPLSQLASQLETSAKAGIFPEQLTTARGVREVDLVTAAFNRVAGAERLSREGLFKAKQAAESASRVKTEFLMNISHELRTPLNGVLGMTDLLLATPLTNEQAEYAGTVRDSANSLSFLIDNILDFSELETGRLRLRHSELNLRSVFDDALVATRARAVHKPIVVEAASLESVPTRFVGEDARIRQIFMHLCHNAVKFTDSGFIRLSAECTHRSHSEMNVKFSVEDTGIGIAPGNLDLVFSQFTQIDGSLTRRHGGTGIGLCIAKAFVELMGGEIGVSSRLGTGSTFWFSVPLQTAGESPPPCTSDPLAGTARCV